MPWRPLPRIAFAICTYPFQPSSAADLPLQIGDELYIIEQGGELGEWFRGYLVAPPSLLAGLTSSKGQALEARVFSGIFPGVCVEIKEELGDSPHAQEGRQPEGDAVDEEHDGILTSPETPTLREGFPTPPRGVLCPARKHKNNGSSESASRVSDDVQQEGPQRPSFPDGPPARKPPAPVPMLKIGDESGASKQEPLVDEIASCLREWHSTNLHELLLSGKYDLLEEMTKLVRRLDSLRRQLLHKILTQKELQSIRESAIWDLVHGNRILTGEVVVRSSAKLGRLLTADDSAVEISSLQSMMSLLDDQPGPPTDTKILHHILLGLKAFTNKMGKSVTISFALYALGESGRANQVSESFAINAPLGATMKPGASENLQTLFTDLSLTDIQNAAGEAPHLFLVIKALTDEPVRIGNTSTSRTASSTDRTTNLSSNTITDSARNSTFKPDRRSLLLGSRRSKTSELLPSATSSRPKTGNSEFRAESGSDGFPNASKPVRRTTGLGVLEVTNIIFTEGEIERDMSIWTIDGHHANASIPESEGEDELAAATLLGFGADISGARKAGLVKVGLTSFSHKDSQELIQATPTTLQAVPTTRRIGFTEAPLHGRSDIYLTVLEPLLARNTFLSHPKLGSVPIPSDGTTSNLQLTLEVRNISGDRVEGCIFPFSNSTGQTAWRTTAAERGEKWDQTIRLAIEAEDVPGSHLVMSIADAAIGFPFALAWMPLWTQDAFVRDGEHALALHSYDEYTSEMISGKRAYLGLPWTPKKKDESVTGHMATVQLRTYLCSTAYSQDPVLLGILKWNTQSSRDLSSLLDRFPFVPELEIVKLLGDVLDALFAILVQYTGDDEIEDAVFNSLVIVLGIVHDRRFNLQPRVDEYAGERFQYPFAFPCLVRSFRRLLADPSSSTTSRKLRSACKVGSHVFHFIVTAWKQQNVKRDGIGLTSHAPSIAKDVRRIFGDMEAIMLDPKATLIGTKTILVQNFANLLVELPSATTSSEILSIACHFVNACSDVQGKLVLYKLLMINSITAAQLFQGPEDAKEWHDNVVAWTMPYWTAPPTINQQWRDQIRICCSILASQRSMYGFSSSDWMPKLVDAYLEVLKLPRPPRDSFSLLFPASYPFPSRTVTRDAIYDESLIELSALLASISRDSANYAALSDDYLSSVLLKLLQVLTSVLDCQAYPCGWLSLHVFHHKTTLQTLQAVFALLAERFLPQPEDAEAFRTELWNAYFSTLLKLVASDILALETFAEQKRRAVWKIAGDVRELGAELLQRSWDAIAWDASPPDRELYNLERIGGFQVQYVPKLVSPAVELCLSVHEGLRGAAISVLKTMIVSEWALAENLNVIETEMMNCLDQMFKRKNINDGMLQKVFLGELFSTFVEYRDGPSKALFSALKNLVDVVNELISLLVSVHSAEMSGEAHQIVDTLRLMDFLRDMQRESIFIDYVHKLAKIQVDAENHTEAGLALRMHADLYEWSSSKILDALKDPPLPSQTAFERKELIYFEMIKCFEEGAAWRQALSTYRELAQVYESGNYDFAKLARTQRAMAAVHEQIYRSDRQIARFFRVTFRGLGFTPGLRDKEFVFEGSSTDRISNFVDKLMRQYPSARLANGTLDDDLEGQYISVFPVGPQKDFLHPVNRQIRVRQSVRDHFTLTQPDHFTMNSKRQASTGVVQDQVQDKTVYTTAEPFPNILRRSEIIKTEVIRLSPVQIGLERATRKTHDLLNLEESAQDGTSGSIAALTDSLKGLLKAKSPSTIAGYWALIPQAETTGEEENLESHQPGVELDPLQEALKVAILDHVMVISRCLSLYSKPIYQHTRAELTKDFETTFALVLDVFATMTGQSDLNSPTWLWNLSQPNPNEAAQPTGYHRRGPSDTYGGALDFVGGQPNGMKTFGVDENDDAVVAGQDDSGAQNEAAPRRINPFRRAKADEALLSSRSSMYMANGSVGEDHTNGIERGPGAFGNATPALERTSSGIASSPVETNSRANSLQSRVTKRLSQLSFGAGKKESRDKVTGTIVETLEE